MNGGECDLIKHIKKYMKEIYDSLRRVNTAPLTKLQ